ncbi:MAG TPA: hypothetical protein VFM11_08480 [Burkholderiales bacterium]|nr:hypothetical protein [Burkholderiales bacterium]
MLQHIQQNDGIDAAAQADNNARAASDVPLHNAAHMGREITWRRFI